MRNQDREREIRLRSKAGVTYEGGKDSISFRDSDDLLYDDDDIITAPRRPHAYERTNEGTNERARIAFSHFPTKRR